MRLDNKAREGKGQTQAYTLLRETHERDGLQHSGARGMREIERKRREGKKRQQLGAWIWGQCTYQRCRIDVVLARSGRLP